MRLGAEIVVRNGGSTTMIFDLNIAHIGVFCNLGAASSCLTMTASFFRISWKETFVELVCHRVVLIVTHQLGKSYFEHKHHKILHFLNLLVKVFLRKRLVKHLLGQVRLYLTTRFVLLVLWLSYIALFLKLALFLKTPLFEYV